MSKQYLVEGTRGAVPFIVDRSKAVTEEKLPGHSVTKFPGRFSICDCVNGNKRRYPKRVWEKNLAEDSSLRLSIARNAAFGLLEHPSDGQINHLSPICILVTDARLVDVAGEGATPVTEVHGEITILNTPEGQRLGALIEAGYNPLVSSRGFGTVTKGTDGIDEVQDDYVCEGWDVVMKPSFEKAEVWAHGESQKEGTPAPTPAPDKVVVEDQKIVKETAAPSPVAAEAAAGSTKPQLTETMDIKDIRNRIGALRAESVPSNPHRFAQAMNEMAELHQEIANFVAEDGKRSWQGQQLHNDLSAIESRWTESVQAPARKASKLTEDYTKVLRVTKAIGETAVGLKKKLGEVLQQRAEAAQLVEELTERGQGWVQLAERRKGLVEELEYKLNVACETLDIVAETYWADTTDLGRRLLTLEFAEQCQTPEVAKALKEAKMPNDIIAIREQLTGKGEKEEKGEKGEKEDEGKDEKDMKEAKDKECPTCHKCPCACKEESKKGEDGKTPVTEGKESPSTPPKLEERVLVPSVRTIDESVDMVRRLSASAK
jgi:hypothetical protein